MQYRAFGNTGLEVSVLSYGASSLGGDFGEVTQEQADRVVRTALDAGINLIDVAPHYGLTRAETVLGEVLRHLPRDRYYLSSKVGRYGGLNFDFSAKRMVESVDESLQRLNTDHLDLVICHDIEFVNIQPVIDEAIPALRKLQAQGKVRFVGVSGLPLKIYETVLAQTELDFILSYCNYTLQNRRLNTLAPRIKAQEMGLINAAPIGMGLLSGGYMPEWHPAPPPLREVCMKAAEFCEKQGVPLPQLALQFAFANPYVDSTLAGTASVEQLERNLACLDAPLDEALLKEVLNILAPIENQIWQSGLPENNGS